MYRKLKDGTVKDIRIDTPLVLDLFRAYSAIQKSIVNLQSNGEHLFSTENMVGELAELLICNRFNLTQEVASNKAYDATDIYGKKYQIKSRWLGNLETLSKNENSMEFGMIDEDVLDDLDYVVIILFNPDFTTNYCYMLDIPTYKKYAHTKKIKNKLGYSITPNKTTRKELTESIYDKTILF